MVASISVPTATLAELTDPVLAVSLLGCGDDVDVFRLLMLHVVGNSNSRLA
jgi:hypothetical protein